MKLMEDDRREICQALKDWEQIQSPSPLQAHSRGWQMVGYRDIRYDDCSIFPPSNHEGLHIPFEQQHQEDQSDDQEQDCPPTPEPQSPTSNIDAQGPPRQPFDSQLRLAGDFVMKRLNLGFEVLCTKLISLASSARSCNRRANWSFARLAGVAAAFLVSLMYLRWKRWRRRSRQEKKDRLILLLREQDEKINQLLDKISQLNELLSGSGRVLFRSH